MLHIPNQRFLDAIEPYQDRIESYFKHRFRLWRNVMGILTDSDLNLGRNMIIQRKIRMDDQVLILIPERANPLRYIPWFENLIRDVGPTFVKNIRIIFSGGVVDEIGTDGTFHSFENHYGEYCAARMDEILRSTCSLYKKHIPPEHVTIENLSKNTGDQACILSMLILGSNSDLVVFLGPAEHVPRFALTVHGGIRTYEPVFRKVYKDRLDKMQMLVYPLFTNDENNNWDGPTDMRGFSAATEAFGPLDTDEKRHALFPNKIRGQELVERLGEEMYYGDGKIMNATTLEDAIKDPLLALELGEFKSMVLELRMP